MISHVCWFVHLFVRDAHCDFSVSKSQIFVKFGADIEHHGQKCWTENLLFVIVWPWFKMSSPNLAVRQE